MGKAFVMGITAAIISGIAAAGSTAVSVVNANKAGQAREDAQAVAAKQEAKVNQAEEDLKKKKKSELNNMAMAGGAARIRAQKSAQLPSMGMQPGGSPLGGGNGNLLLGT